MGSTNQVEKDRLGYKHKRNRRIVVSYLDNPNRSLSDIGSDYGVSRTAIAKVLKNYFGDDWEKTRKFYKCNACGVMFHGWDKHFGTRAIYCQDCFGKYRKGDRKKETI